MGAVKNFLRFWRLYFLFLCFLVVAAALGSRLFFLQIENRGFYKALAQGQQTYFETAIPSRGDIFFVGRTPDGTQEYITAATNTIQKSAVVSQREIRDPAKSAQIIARIFAFDEERIEALLKEERPYGVLKKVLTEEEERKLQEANIQGVYLKSVKKREYPEKEHGAHVIGFSARTDDGEEDGQYGIERFYNEELSSPKRQRKDGGKDTGGTSFFSASKMGFASRRGADLYLTIDYQIQYAAEKLLREGVAFYKARGGEIIVMDPNDGRILADAVEPSFDPNAYSSVENLRRFLNPAVQEQFEPGSIFKPFIVAAALETGKATPLTSYYDKGYVVVGPEVIKNFEERVYNEQTVTGILEKSINTGMVFVSQLLGKEDMKEFIKRFGFGARTGIDLPGEINGDISNLNNARDIHYATASFGQGVAVTSMQLISAFSAFANGGKRVVPYVVEKKVFPDGREELHSTSATGAEQIISPETAKAMTSILVSVIENGTGKRARISGYSVAGKTGTAQIPKKNGRGYGEETFHTFAGYAPAYDPKFIILVKMENPLGVRAAEGSVVPIFKDLAQYIINYLEIPSDVRTYDEQ